MSSMNPSWRYHKHGNKWYIMVMMWYIIWYTGIWNFLNWLYLDWLQICRESLRIPLSKAHFAEESWSLWHWYRRALLKYEALYEPCMRHLEWIWGVSLSVSVIMQSDLLCRETSALMNFCCTCHRGDSSSDKPRWTTYYSSARNWLLTGYEYIHLY